MTTPVKGKPMFLHILFVLVTILSSSLLNQSFARPQQKVDTVKYSLCKQTATPFKLSGFSAPEVAHIWTDGKQASITFPIEIDGKRVQSIMLKDTSAYVTNSHPQTVSVFMNGTRLIGNYKYSVDKPLNTIIVKIPSTMRGTAKITFQMPNAMQPSSNDPKSKDTRQLGLSLADIDVSFKGK
jgi:hypothetical protein